MADIFYADNIKEWTSTYGTDRPYILMGALADSFTFYQRVPDGSLVYYKISDGVRHERGLGRFVAANTLEVVYITSSSNSGNSVNWANRGRRFVELDTSPAEFFTQVQSSDDAFWASIELGTAVDLGDLDVDQVITTVDMGDLTAILTDTNDGLIDLIDLGEQLV